MKKTKKAPGTTKHQEHINKNIVTQVQADSKPQFPIFTGEATRIVRSLEDGSVQLITPLASVWENLAKCNDYLAQVEPCSDSVKNIVLCFLGLPAELQGDAHAMLKAMRDCGHRVEP